MCIRDSTCTSGEILVDGEEVSKMDARQLTTYRRYDIGFVFQFYNLVQNLTARENVELAVQICKNPLDVDQTIEAVGLRERRSNFPSQLSGGEQQRVAIARALAKNPKLLLLSLIHISLVVLANLFVIFTKAAASASRIEAILKTEPAITGGITELSKDKDAVLEMDKVSFGYSEGESAIEQISFTIQPHQTVGLIGGTGCGKSTIVQLLPRLIDPTAGEIWLGGVPLRELSLADLRRQIRIVPQKAVLFSGTIRENRCV